MIETKNLSFIYREEDMESGEIKEEKVLKDINIEKRSRLRKIEESEIIG